MMSSAGSPLFYWWLLAFFDLTITNDFIPPLFRSTHFVSFEFAAPTLSFATLYSIILYFYVTFIILVSYLRWIKRCHMFYRYLKSFSRVSNRSLAFLKTVDCIFGSFSGWHCLLDVAIESLEDSPSLVEVE
jgi:hypothetical protein